MRVTRTASLWSATLKTLVRVCMVLCAVCDMQGNVMCCLWLTMPSAVTMSWKAHVPNAANVRVMLLRFTMLGIVAFYRLFSVDQRWQRATGAASVRRDLEFDVCMSALSARTSSQAPGTDFRALNRQAVVEGNFTSKSQV